MNNALTKLSDKFLILRAFLCVVVVISHLPIVNVSWNIGGYDISWLNKFDGHTMVLVFMILSGYLIGKQFYSGKYSFDFGGVVSFWKSRIIRIVPIYYSVIFLELLLYRREFLTNIDGLGLVFQALFFWFNVDKLPNLSGSFWSLSVEMQFYLVAPIFVLFLIRIPSKIAHLTISLICLFIFDLFVRRLVVPTLDVNQLKHLSIHFVMFLFGILLNNIRPLVNWKFFESGFSSILICLYFPFLLLSSNYMLYRMYSMGKRVFENTAYIGLVVVITGFVILLMDNYSSQAKDLRSTKKGFIGSLEKLGLLSYPVYIGHGLVLNLSYPVLAYNYAIGAIVYFGGSLIFGLYLYKWNNYLLYRLR